MRQQRQKQARLVNERRNFYRCRELMGETFRRVDIQGEDAALMRSGPNLQMSKFLAQGGHGGHKGLAKLTGIAEILLKANKPDPSKGSKMRRYRPEDDLIA